MKNIHLIPTDKPSRLVKFFTNKFHLCKEILPIQDEEQYQHIYITSDEEIKEGDWYIIEFNSTKITKCTSEQELISIEGRNDCQKIIITTDQDLIEDDVQAIDDEFLEWFVKNPSCEKVEVKPLLSNNGRVLFGYKIIIPKEELTRKIDTRKPKQYPIGGYAPGNYSCTCVTCKIDFIGDKLAVQCEPCAIEMTEGKSKEEQIKKEILKCKESPYYFATTYLTIKNHKGENVKYETYLTEKEFNSKFNL